MHPNESILRKRLETLQYMRKILLDIGIEQSRTRSDFRPTLDALDFVSSRIDQTTKQLLAIANTESPEG